MSIEWQKEENGLGRAELLCFPIRSPWLFRFISDIPVFECLAFLSILSMSQFYRNTAETEEGRGTSG
ncbi:hypothetical protein Q1695_006879 [Nippostrongylus brasiliensis]|nr:hypothetical protein Q1695_006879 [Nippostrongylus brasiliensis]